MMERGAGVCSSTLPSVQYTQIMYLKDLKQFVILLSQCTVNSMPYMSPTRPQNSIQVTAED